MTYNKLSVQLYRSLFRLSYSPLVKTTKFQIQLEEAQKFSMNLCEPAKIYSNQKGLQELLRCTKQNLKTEDSKILQDFFDLIKYFDKFEAYLKRLNEIRWQSLNTQHPILFPLGTVFRHKKYGYRGVVIGFDTRIKRSEEWMKNFEIDKLQRQGDQPFYHVIPDNSDCYRIFNGYRESKYVAEDNCELVTGSEAQIEHPFIEQFFADFDSDSSKFLPNETLDFLYPVKKDETTINIDAPS